MERKIKVEKFNVEYLCDTPGCKGTLHYTNDAEPPKYKHRCETCGLEKYFTDKVYPHSVEEEVES